MSSTNNIKDALIRNNTMIANELKTNFAKKSEVSELATDKVDKRTFAVNNEVEGEIKNTNGKISIKSNSMEANQASNTEIKLSTNCGDGIDVGHTNNELIIGATGAHSQYDRYGIVAQSYRMPSGNQEDSIYNILNIDADDIEIVHKEGVVISTYNLLNSLDTVDNVADNIDALYENGIGAFNFDKVFSGDDNIISSQTITFGTDGNYKSLLDLSKFVFSPTSSGNNYDYNDDGANRTRFSNRTQNNPLRIPVKKGGVLTISSGSSANINATITINNSSTTVTSLPYSTVVANYDQYITILFTSTITANKFTQMTVTNFVNVYITENKLRANYYNKSEVDTAINNIGGVSLSGDNTFTGSNMFTGEFEFSRTEGSDSHCVEIDTNVEEYDSNFSARAGRDNNPAALRLVSGSTSSSAAWIKDKTTASLLVGTTYFNEIENQPGAGLVLISHVDGGSNPNELSARLFAYTDADGLDYPKNDILLNKDGIDIQFYEDEDEPKYINNIRLNTDGITLLSVEDGEEDYDSMQLNLDAFDIKWSNDKGTTEYSLTKCYNYVLEFTGATVGGSETATIQYAFTGPEYITGSSTTKTGPVAWLYLNSGFWYGAVLLVKPSGSTDRKIGYAAGFGGGWFGVKTLDGASYAVSLTDSPQYTITRYDSFN